MSLRSIPNSAIVSIQLGPMQAPVFMTKAEAVKALNSRHVGGNPLMMIPLINSCSPGSCKASSVRGGSKRQRQRRKKTRRLSRWKN